MHDTFPFMFSPSYSSALPLPTSPPNPLLGQPSLATFVGTCRQERRAVVGSRGGSADCAGSGQSGCPPSAAKRKWFPLSMTEEQLNKLATLGYIPLQTMPAWRAPARGDSSAIEVVLAAQEGERVVLLPLVLQGMSLALHDFFTGLVFIYGLEMHHLTLNGILHTACFITPCECFLAS